MNEEDCIVNDFYWVHVTIHTRMAGVPVIAGAYEVARFRGIGERWDWCGTDLGFRYNPDDDLPFNEWWIDKIISHIERPNEQ